MDVLVPLQDAPVDNVLFGRKNKSKAIVNDDVFAIPDVERPLGAHEVMAFRLIHGNPSSQKLMSRLAKLRGDHVAVTLHRVHSVNDAMQVVSLADEVDAFAQTRILGLDSFISLGWEEVAQRFLELQVRCHSYSFNAPLSPSCHGDVGR